MSEAIFDSLVISLFAQPGDFGAAQFELDLVVALFFDPKPRMPQLHFLATGGVGRALVLISDGSAIFVFAASAADSSPDCEHGHRSFGVILILLPAHLSSFCSSHVQSSR